MEVHAVRAEIGETVHGVDGIERRSRLVAERITAAVADRPEAEREAVARLRLVLVRHPLMFHDGRSRGNMRA